MRNCVTEECVRPYIFSSFRNVQPLLIWGVHLLLTWHCCRSQTGEPTVAQPSVTAIIVQRSM